MGHHENVQVDLLFTVNKNYNELFFPLHPLRNSLVLLPQCLGEGANGGAKAEMNRGHRGDRLFCLLS